MFLVNAIMRMWIHINSSHRFASRTFLLLAQLRMPPITMMIVSCVNYCACLVTFVNDEQCKLDKPTLINLPIAWVRCMLEEKTIIVS